MRMSRLSNSKSVFYQSSKLLWAMVNNFICQSVRVCKRVFVFVCVWNGHKLKTLIPVHESNRTSAKLKKLHTHYCTHIHFIISEIKLHHRCYTIIFIVSDHNLPCVACTLFEQVQINITELHKALLQQLVHLLSAGKRLELLTTLHGMRTSLIETVI